MGESHPMNVDDLATWEPFLKRSILFADLPPEDFQRIGLTLKPLSLPKGSLLFRQGDPGENYYLITSGQVRILVQKGLQENVAAFLSRGDSLGEMSFLTGELYTYTGKLDTTCEFLTLSKVELDEVLKERPGIALHFARVLSKRLLVSAQAREEARAVAPNLIGVMFATSPEDRTLFASALAFALLEQTRRRLALVDLSGSGGRIAEALGLKAPRTSAGMLREQDLRDPDVLARLTLNHPSGLELLAFSPQVLSGRLFRAIFMLLNLLRESHDFVLLCMEDEFAEVQREVLAEADQTLLVSHHAFKDRRAHLEAALEKALPEVQPLHVDLAETTQFPDRLGPKPARIAWPEGLAEALTRTGSPFQALESAPRTQVALERLARHLARLKLGIAMGSGGALGYSILGILKVFERHHIFPDVVAGTSIGAVIGANYAAGIPLTELEARLKAIDKAWLYENVFWDVSVPRSGVLGGTTMLRMLHDTLGGRSFDDLELPFAAVATDIRTGEEIVLREGKLADAVRASAGIPVLFRPYHYQGRFLVDGGLVDPVPARVVSQMGADILLSVNLTRPAAESRLPKKRLADALGFEMPADFKGPNMAEVLFKTLYTMQYQISQSRLELAHVTISPDLKGYSWLEFYRARELIEAGERAAEEALPKIKQFLPFFSDYCKVPLRAKTVRIF